MKVKVLNGKIVAGSGLNSETLKEKNKIIYTISSHSLLIAKYTNLWERMAPFPSLASLGVGIFEEFKQPGLPYTYMYEDNKA